MRATAALLLAANGLAIPVPLGAAPGATPFRVEEATIDSIQSAILKGELTSTQVVELYLKRIRAYDGPCVTQPDGILGPFSTIPHAGQINSLITVNLRPAARAAHGLGARKARSLTDAADSDPGMPDALEVAAKQDAYFKANGKLVGPLHGITFAIKDWYDTRDMRTTAGADAGYANDRPPRDATFITRMREAGGIILAKANVGSGISRSPFGGISCNPYDTERSAGTSSSGSGTSVAANLVTCAIAEETGGSILHPTKNNSVVGLAPTQELVSRNGMYGAGYNTRTGPICRTVKDAAKVLDVIAGYDPKDELTVFSVGRMPASPYQSFAAETRLAGLRIGVLREYMDRSLFNEADEESIAAAERAIADLQKLGATIVDPGPGGALLTDLHREVRAVGDEQAVHRAVPRGVPHRRERQAGGRSHRVAGGDVPGSVAHTEGRHAQEPWARRIRRRVALHDRALPQGARRRQHQDDERPGREVAGAHRHTPRLRQQRPRRGRR